MFIRLLLFFIFLPFIVFSIIQQLHLPIDGILGLFLFMVPLVIGMFGYYRYIGKLRTAGKYSKALFHLRFWKYSLPNEVYHQLRLQILVESDMPEKAHKELQIAESKELVDFPYIYGFRADLARREGDIERAENLLQEVLESLPTGLLRGGVLAQLVRLYALHRSDKQSLKTAQKYLIEAEALLDSPSHLLLLQAIRGEWHLARKEYKLAVEHLKTGVEGLLRMDRENDLNLFARITNSQQDEHQYPLYAEFCLSLSRAYEALKHREDARNIAQKGFGICQQDFVAQHLRPLSGK